MAAKPTTAALLCTWTLCAKNVAVVGINVSQQTQSAHLQALHRPSEERIGGGRHDGCQCVQRWKPLCGWRQLAKVVLCAGCVKQVGLPSSEARRVLCCDTSMEVLELPMVSLPTNSRAHRYTDRDANSSKFAFVLVQCPLVGDTSADKITMKMRHLVLRVLPLPALDILRHSQTGSSWRK